MTDAVARVFISRTGIINSLGTNSLEVLERLDTGLTPGPPSERPDGVRWARPSYQGLLSDHETKKMDAFTVMAVETSLRMGLEGYDREDLSIFMGTCMGGIGFAEEELKHLYHGGPRKVSPYLAIAMFYSSNLSQIAIHNQIHGQCSMFSEGAVSSASAIRWAYEHVRHGLVARVLAGGSEAPTTELGTKAFTGVGAPAAAFGFLSDACALLLLERDGLGADAEALEVSGFGECGPGGAISGSDVIARCLERCLENAGWTPGEVDLVVLNQDGILDNDAHELAALEWVFGLATPALMATKASIGYSFGAAQVQDVALLDACLRRRDIPAALRFRDPRFTQRALNWGRPLRALVVGVDVFGRSISLAFTKGSR